MQVLKKNHNKPLNHPYIVLADLKMVNNAKMQQYVFEKGILTSYCVRVRHVSDGK